MLKYSNHSIVGNYLLYDPVDIKTSVAHEMIKLSIDQSPCSHATITRTSLRDQPVNRSEIFNEPRHLRERDPVRDCEAFARTTQKRHARYGKHVRPF